MENLHCGLDEKAKNIQSLIPIRAEANNGGFIINENNYGLEFKRRQDLSQTLNIKVEEDEFSNTLLVKPKKNVPFINHEDGSFVVNISLNENDGKLNAINKSMRNINLNQSYTLNNLNNTSRLMQSINPNSINPRADWITTNNNNDLNNSLFGTSKNVSIHAEKLGYLKKRVHEEHAPNLDQKGDDENKNTSKNHENFSHNYEQHYNSLINSYLVCEGNLNNSRSSNNFSSKFNSVRQLTISKNGTKNYEHVENPFKNNAEYKDAEENNASYNKNLAQKIPNYDGYIKENNSKYLYEPKISGINKAEILGIEKNTKSKSPQPRNIYSDSNIHTNYNKVSHQYNSTNLNDVSVNSEKTFKVQSNIDVNKRLGNIPSSYYTSKKSLNDINNNNSQVTFDANKRLNQEELKNDFNNQVLSNNITKSVKFDDNIINIDNEPNNYNSYENMGSNIGKDYIPSTPRNKNTYAIDPNMNQQSKKYYNQAPEDGKYVENYNDRNINKININSFDINNLEKKRTNY